MYAPGLMASFDVPGSSIRHVVSVLLDADRPVNVEPLPDDMWQVTVKDEYRRTVRQIIASNGTWCFEDGVFAGTSSESTTAFKLISAGNLAALSGLFASVSEHARRGLAGTGNGLLLMRALADKRADIAKLLVANGSEPAAGWDEDLLAFFDESVRGV